MKATAKDVVVAVAILLVFWSVGHSQETALKNEINTAVAAECSSNAEATIIGKYNDLAQGLVDQQTTALGLNTKAGETAKAAADAAYAARFKADIIAIVKQDCSTPLLK